VRFCRRFPCVAPVLGKSKTDAEQEVAVNGYYMNRCVCDPIHTWQSIPSSANLWSRFSRGLCRSSDRKMVQLLPGFERSSEPSRLQSAAGPCLRWVVRIAVFRRDFNARTATTAANGPLSQAKSLQNMRRLFSILGSIAARSNVGLHREPTLQAPMDGRS
jgi:hypothetical protein